MIPLVVIRPEPGCVATVAAAREQGLEAQGFPLFAVVPRAWAAPSASDFDALLVGSANAFRHGGAALEALRALPVQAVGEATAVAALKAGFKVECTGNGGLQVLLDKAAPGTRLLRLSGEERVELAPPAGVTVEERVVYASEARPMPQELAELLRKGAVVLLHSGEAARHFAAECDRLALPRNRIALAALAPRIAASAAEGWAACAIADQPQDAALLALAGQLCQTVSFKQD